MKIVVIGGGAAGFFAALAAKELNPQAEVILIERGTHLLNKVRISGGGRCNVTHACFEPQQLVQNYPRGQKELLGPFHQFQPLDTIEWFRQRGVTLKKEKDGRMFPTTDSSETIIHCLKSEAEKLGVKIWTQTQLHNLRKAENGFVMGTGVAPDVFVDRVILATGSAKGGWDFARNFGHTIQPPVPSLFTFNIPSFPLVDLAGVSVPFAKLKLAESRLESEGPLLITHWGFSGPGALKLSALGARFLAEKKYEVSLLIDWVPESSSDQIYTFLEREKRLQPHQVVASLKLPPLPKSLWKRLTERGGLLAESPLNSIGKSSLLKLVETLKCDRYAVKGKTTNKEEFVTCGGVTLSEVNFKTMESKCTPHLYFCGEILDIDGITGGFNFQNAWTTGWIAGRAASGGG